MEDNAEDLEKIRNVIRNIPDYPKPGVNFKDITPVLKDAVLFSLCVDKLCRELSTLKFKYVIGIESRGFILGSAVAYKMGKGFVPARKKGKLPHKTIKQEYKLEYGFETLEMHIDAIENGSSVIIVDDLLATGGTVEATAAMIKKLGGKVQAMAFAIELEFLNGRERLKNNKIISLLKY